MGRRGSGYRAPIFDHQRSPWPEDFLFPSAAGTVRSPNIFRRQWRDASEGSDYEWVTPHILRRTVATIIDRKYSSKDAAAQLGHSGNAVTEKQYIEKPADATIP